MFVRVRKHPYFCFVSRVFGQNVEGGVSVISIVMHQLNEDIRDKELRLIGSDGEQLGIMSADEALRIADEKGMDLVKISPSAKRRPARTSTLWRSRRSVCPRALISGILM